MSADLSTKHLAHDLNNIFTRILNSIDLLKRKVSSSSDLLPILNSIEAGTYLASEMIGDNFDNKSKKNNQRRININSIVSDIVRSVIIQQKGKIDFKLFLEPNLKLVLGKYSDYYRVILNLLTNSIESIESTGVILFTTSNIDDGARVELRIKDSGKGIEKEILPLVFDEDFSTKSKKTASGIGLSIVKKIIENYGGTISVLSEPGNGTEFIITLEAAHTATPLINDSGKTILIAEDEDILRELLAELLQSYNYTVLTSSNGKEVLETLKARMPDLLIIDRKMPEMDGIECLQEIAAANYNLPVILASGSPVDNVKIEIENVNKVINKPYNFEELLSLVRELIG
ncbi:MAG: response regulator [Ignavibacteriales bacterium]|nr:response regulator [Ignavibacteriales bacterium]